MSTFRWLLFRLRTLTIRRQREADLEAEIAFHLEADAEEAAAEGTPADEARRAAVRRFGNVARAREESRRVWQFVWLEELQQDLRYAVRVLRRRPGFTTTAVLTLGLGIGANLAIFSLLDNLLWKPLPVARPNALVRLNDGGDEVRYSTYERLRQQSRAFDGIAAMTTLLTPEIEHEGTTERVALQLVSSNYFEVLGVPPFRGRVFAEPPPGGSIESLAVISYDLWQRGFDGDPAALGSRVRYGEDEFVIAGVAPEGVHGANIDEPADMWLPFDAVIAADSPGRTQGRWIQVLGRLREGETAASAQAEASVILERAVRFEGGGVGFSSLRRDLSRPLFLLGAITGLVLLITCTNLANLALAGSAARERELAVRQAIGASRGRITRQLLTEGTVLTLAGTGLALVIAPLTSAALLSFLPPAQARALTNLTFAFDLRVLATVGALAFATCLLTGLIPAVRAARPHATAAIRVGAAAGPGTSWTSRGLVIAEVAMCTVVLITATVFVRTVHNLRAQDAGYVEDHLLVAEAVSQVPRPEWIADVHALLDHFRALPGVKDAGFSHAGQLSGFGINGTVSVPGSVALSETALDPLEHRVSPRFLTTMGARFLAGRDIADTDDEGGQRVAVVNEAFARQYFGEIHVVGRQFVRAGASDDTETTTIIGVVQDSKWIDLREPAPVMYYVPYRQHSASAVTFVVRADGDLDALGAQLVQVARALDPRMELSNVVPFREIVNRTLVIERLVAHVSTAFAALGLLIAAIGLYGILAYAVVRRTREIGVRIAMGATSGTVEWFFVRESFALLLAGFAIGLPAAMLVTRSVSALLFGLEPGDPMATAAALAILTVTCLAASFTPARRAARIEPIRALRED